VSKAGGAGFEGYWRNEEAERVRVRNGWYWTGDLAYRDEAGFFYFAGRDHDWIRVDGENFATAPVERIVSRYPGTVVTAAYAVPDTIVGDQVMVAIEQGAEAAPFDGEDFARFLAAQGDLGTKWAPRYVRLCPELPKTATSKILKRELRAERWNTPDPLWWRPDPDAAYRLLTGAERSSLEAALRRATDARRTRRRRCFRGPRSLRSSAWWRSPCMRSRRRWRPSRPPRRGRCLTECDERLLEPLEARGTGDGRLELAVRGDEGVEGGLDVRRRLGDRRLLLRSLADRVVEDPEERRLGSAKLPDSTACSMVAPSFAELLDSPFKKVHSGALVVAACWVPVFRRLVLGLLVLAASVATPWCVPADATVTGASATMRPSASAPSRS